MNNTTYTANENCFLIEGEVYLIDESIPKKLNHWVYLASKGKMLQIIDDSLRSIMVATGAPVITHSTKPLEGVKPLPREKFVKPKDVDLLSEFERLKGYECDRFDNEEWSEYEWFKQGAGHNANPNEFTREEMIQAMTMTGAYADSNPRATHQDVMKYIGNYINSLRPLTLPASLEINEQGEIVNVIW